MKNIDSHVDFEKCACSICWQAFRVLKTFSCKRALNTNAKTIFAIKHYGYCTSSISFLFAQYYIRTTDERKSDRKRERRRKKKTMYQIPTNRKITQKKNKKKKFYPTEFRAQNMCTLGLVQNEIGEHKRNENERDTKNIKKSRKIPFSTRKPISCMRKSSWVQCENLFRKPRQRWIHLNMVYVYIMTIYVKFFVDVVVVIRLLWRNLVHWMVVWSSFT